MLAGATSIKMLAILAAVTIAAEVKAGIVSRIPLGRVGETDDIVGPAIFLVSDAASFVTGFALATIPFPDVTPDRLLTAVFGGFFLGAGIGLAIVTIYMLAMYRVLGLLVIGQSAPRAAMVMIRSDTSR